MKKKFLLLLIITLLFLCGCQNSEDPEKNEDEPSVPVGSESVEDDEEQTSDENQTSNEDEPSNEETPQEEGTDTSQAYDPCLDYGLPIPTQTHTYDDGNKLILVNKQYAITPDFYPSDMVAVDGSLSTNQGIYFKREAYDAYLKMLADANAQGLNFLICSTYRSYGVQESIYFSHINAYGVDYTNTVSAYPGRSEHHTGWAVDVTCQEMGYDLLESFIDLPQGQWINAHCHEYGFIIRYPKDKTHITGYAYEPWHLRYVGVDAATEIMSKGLTLEEYLGVA